MRKYIITILLLILMVMVGVKQVNSKINTTEIKNKNVNKRETIVYTKQRPEVNENYIMMQGTGYDLSIQCCGKSYSNPSRGIARDGFDLNNKSHNEAWVVSSNRFPLGTRLKLEFPESHKKYSGVYTVRDTGNFKENVLDIYVGDFGEKVNQNTIEFGRVDVKVYVIE